MRRLLVVLLALVVAPTATAAFSVSITSSSPQTFASVTLNGLDQTAALDITIKVVNTGAPNTTGWNVTAAAGLPTAGANTLSALQVTGVTNANCTGAGCVDPTNDVTWPQALAAGGVKIFNAAAGTGKGTVILTATLEMTYDAKALPGLYKSTLTVAGVRSP